MTNFEFYHIISKAYAGDYSIDNEDVCHFYGLHNEPIGNYNPSLLLYNGQ